MPSRAAIPARVLSLAALCVLILSAPSSHAQSTERLLKAGYIEKFTRFVEWPSLPESGGTTAPFTIAVIGDNRFGNAIETIFGKTKVKGRNARIVYIAEPGEIRERAMLIVSDSETERLPEILKRLEGKPILTIGETAGFGRRGIMINMFMDHDYIRFEINRDALERQGLRANSLLLAAAVIVSTDE